MFSTSLLRGAIRRVGMGLSKYSLIVGLLSDSGIELPIVGFFSRIVGFLLRIVGFFRRVGFLIWIVGFSLNSGMENEMPRVC
jgi:hypothetical protein